MPPPTGADIGAPVDQRRGLPEEGRRGQSFGEGCEGLCAGCGRSRSSKAPRCRRWS